LTPALTASPATTAESEAASPLMMEEFFREATVASPAPSAAVATLALASAAFGSIPPSSLLSRSIFFTRAAVSGLRDSSSSRKTEAAWRTFEEKKREESNSSCQISRTADSVSIA